MLANESKGLSQSDPAPRSQKKTIKRHRDSRQAEQGQAGQTKSRDHQRRAANLPSRSRRSQPRLASNRARWRRWITSVPFGAGGPVAGPYTTFQSGSTAGGMKFGEGGNGSFGSRFGWYTDVVARKVHQAWQSEVNPSIDSAKRVYILFDISRSGTPSNVRIEQSSGIPSLDHFGGACLAAHRHLRPAAAGNTTAVMFPWSSGLITGAERAAHRSLERVE